MSTQANSKAGSGSDLTAGDPAIAAAVATVLARWARTYLVVVLALAVAVAVVLYAPSRVPPARSCPTTASSGCP